MRMTQARFKASLGSSEPMRPAPAPVSRYRARSTRGSHGVAGWSLLALALACALAGAPARAAQPFIWDQDTNGVDDRIEGVNVLGWSASFVLGDTTLHQRIEVIRGLLPELVYGVYVMWKHEPTEGDLAELALLGMPVLSRIEAVDASRSIGTYPQIVLASALPSVDRVEAAPLLYPETRDGAAAIGVRDASNRVFPTLATAAPGLQGHGVVV